MDGRNEKAPTDQKHKGNKGKADDENDIPLYPATARLWIPLILGMICYIITLFSVYLILTQYLTKRIAKEKFHFDLPVDDDKNRCQNLSGPAEQMQIVLQKEVTDMVLNFSLASGIPAIFVCLLIGSYSDFIGRKPLVLASTFGSFAKAVSLCLVIGLNLDLRIIYIGALLDGLVGSSFTTITAVTALIADITRPSERAIKFMIIEAVLLISYAASQVLIGKLITEFEFLIPTIAVSSLCLLVFVLIFFLLPETNQKQSNVKKNPVVHLKRVFGFYFYKGSDNKRQFYIMGAVLFFLFVCTNSGKAVVELLYISSPPLCWTAFDVGVFIASRLVVSSAVSVVLMNLAGKCLSLEIIGILAVISTIAGLVLEALATTSSMMFISAAIGVLVLILAPIPRILLSEITSASQQGALSSGLSTIEAVASLMSQAVFAAIYKSTVGSLKGAVFIVAAALCFIFGVLLLVFWSKRRNNSPKEEDSFDL